MQGGSRRRPTSQLAIAENLLAIAASACAFVLLLFFTMVGVLTGGARAGVAALAAGVLGGALAWWRRSRVPSAESAEPPRHWTGLVRRRMVALVAIGFVMAVGTLVANVVAARRPSQAQVAARFRTHAAELDVLREMVLADGLTGVSGAGTSFAKDLLAWGAPERAGITPARAAEYQRLLIAADCDDVFVSGEGAVSFPVAGWGMANRGWRVSLSWLPQPPPRVVASIDDLGGTQGDVVHSHVEGNWYVAFVW